MNHSAVEREKKLAIARKIASSLLEKPPIKVDDTSQVVENLPPINFIQKPTVSQEAVVAVQEARFKRSLKLILTNKAKHVYNMDIEQQLITERNFSLLFDELHKMQRIEGLRMASLVEVLTHYLEMALFGCGIDVGMCTDSSARAVEFVSESNYRRKVHRGDSPCFFAMDQKEIIIEQMTAKQKPKNPRPSNAGPIFPNTGGGGTYVVYVPLVGSSSPQGVIEIHGMLPENAQPSEYKTYQRSAVALKAMIHAKEYKFKDSIRLWKRASDARKTPSDSEINFATCGFVISGRVTEVALTKKGLPYYGGPRYTIKWENGEVQEETSANDLIELYRQTPQSLGISSVLDNILRDQLLIVGQMAGRILEQQRVKLFLKEMRASINVINIKYHGIVEIALQALSSMIHGCREVAFVGYNSKTADMRTLVDYFTVKKSKQAVMEYAKSFEYSVQDITKEILKRRKQKFQTLTKEDNHNSDWIALEMQVASVDSLGNDSNSDASSVISSTSDSSKSNSISRKFSVLPSDAVKANFLLARQQTGAIIVQQETEFYWAKKNDYNRFFIILNRDKSLNNKTSPLDLSIFSEVVEEVSKAIIIIWNKDVRRRARKDLLGSIEKSFFDWKQFSITELCHNVITAVAPVMPFANVYIGLLSPGGNSISYVASSLQSKMEGRVLNRGEGVSFDVINTLNTLILRPEDMNKSALIAVGSPVNVYYGKALYKAKVAKNRGHECFDIVYDFDGKTEAGVDISRLVPISAAFRVKKFGKTEFPFICVAIRNRNKIIGVLGVDNINKIPKAPQDSHPDADLINFLQQLGKLVGANIDAQRKAAAMKSLYLVAKNQFSTINDVFDSCFEVIFSNMCFATSVVASRFGYEKETVKSERGLHILRAKGAEMSREMMHKLNGFDINRSNQKALQKYGDKNVWLFCKLRSELRGGEGKIFIIVLSCRETIQDPDYEFLESLQKMICGTLQNIVSQKAKSEMRYEALHDIKLICETWEQRTPRELFTAVVENVTSCFYTTNLYVGVLGSFNKTIEYILASHQSNMVGNVLNRPENPEGHGVGVSFQAIDEGISLYVTQGSDLSQRLNHFGPKHMLEYPYVAIPLIAHLDATMGILGVDGCEEASLGENRDEIISFFTTVATYLSKAIRGFRAQQARRLLCEIAQHSNSYVEGIREIKQVLSTVLPFSKRIVEVLYEPREADLNFALEDEVKLIFSYVIIVQILSAVCTSKTVRSPFVDCVWQGHHIYSTKVTSTSSPEMKSAPLLIQVPKSVPRDAIAVHLVLNGSTGDSKNVREIARKSLGLSYLQNAPLYEFTHILEAGNLKEVQVGSVSLLTKVLYLEQVVGFKLSTISVRLSGGMISDNMSVRSHRSIGSVSTTVSPINNAANANNDDKRAIFLIVKWNEVEIQKLKVLHEVKTFRWTHLDLYMRIGHFIDKLETSFLSIEVWDAHDFISGRPKLYGSMSISGSKLKDYLDIQSQSWLDVQTNKPNGFGDNNSVYSSAKTVSTIHEDCGALRLQGSVVSAAEMNIAQMEAELGIGEKQFVPDTGADNDRLFHQCELGVIMARDLARSSTWAENIEANCYAIISFNGEEVGRTAVIQNNSSPEWEEEVFVLRVPANEELLLCSMQIELYHIYDVCDKNEFLGRVELTGKKLTTLIGGTKLRKQWFDLSDVQSSDSMKVSKSIEVCGELKLSGRPLSVDITGLESDAKELGHMELSLLGFSNLKKTNNMLSQVGARTLTRAIVYFNERKVFQSSDSEGSNDGAWSSEDKVLIRYPNNTPMFQCRLRIEIRQILSSTAHQKERLIGLVEIESSALVKLMEQQGLVTKWFPIAFDSISEVPISGSEIPEIKLRGGPKGTADILEYNSEEISLDILSACCIPEETLGVKLNTYCVVSWNEKIVGQTVVVNSTSNPIWSLQRFALRVPVPEETDESPLTQCKLRIDVYNKPDSHNNNSRSLVGSLILKDTEVEEFLGCDQAQTRWFDLTTSVEEGNLESFAKSEIKLRGGAVGAVDDPSCLQQSEFSVSVLSAHGLNPTDIFGGCDSFFKVQYRNRVILQSAVVNNSTDPQFEGESCLVRVSTDHSESLCLVVQMFGFVRGTPPVFLGEFQLKDSQLKDFLSSTTCQTFPLVKCLEFTDEENELVGGSVTMQAMRLVSSVPVSNNFAIIRLMFAEGLPNSSSFGTEEDDIYVKVFRKSDMESGDDVEIHRSKIVPNARKLQFHRERATIRVPAFDDWSGLHVRIEVWNASVDELIGVIESCGIDLQDLLTSSDITEMAPVTLSLMSSEDGETFQEVPDATLTVTAGPAHLFDKIVEEMPLNDAMSEVSASMVLSSSAKLIGGGTVATGTIMEDPLEYTENQTLEMGDVANITVLRIGQFAEGRCFCVLEWNNEEIGTTTTFDDALSVPNWEDEAFDLNLNAGNSFVGCTLDIQVYSVTRRGEQKLVGSLHLDETQLVSVFEPSSKEAEFPLRLNTSVSRKDKAVIVLNGVIPRIQADYDAIRLESLKIDPSSKKADPSTDLFKVKIKLIGASGLLKTSKLGRATDSYAVVYWNDELEPLGKTEVISNSLNPLFELTEFIAIKRAGMKLTDCSLRIKLYGKSFMTADVLLGDVVMEGEDLDEYVSNNVMNVITRPLEKSDETGEGSANQTATVQGTVQFQLRKVTDVETSPLFNNQLPLPSYLKEIELTVIAASGLGRANTFGLSDPHCIVRWGPAEVGQTTVINETVDPVWEENQSFLFRVPKNMQSTTVDERKRKTPNSPSTHNSGKSGTSKGSDKYNLSARFNASNRYLALSKKSGRTSNRSSVKKAAAVNRNLQQQQLEDKMHIDAINRFELVLCIDVYDWNRFGKSVFLGCIELRDEELKEFFAVGKFTRKWFNLIQTDRLKKGDQKLVQGKIQLLFTQLEREEDAATAAEGLDLEVAINSARGLMLKEDSDHLIDSFVRFRWNGKLVGKTNIVKGSGSPIWDDELFAIHLPGTMLIEDCVMHLEVWNSKNNTFLGCCDITEIALKQFIEESHWAPKWFTLATSDYLPEVYYKDVIVHGQLELRCGPTGAHLNLGQHTHAFEVSLFGAKDLFKIDSGNDAYAICKWNGREIGRTSVAAKTQDPQWSDGHFLVSLDESAEINTNILHIDVWNNRLLTKGEFLGCVVLSGDKVAEFFDAANDGKKLWFNLEHKSSLDRSKQRFVRGKIEMCIKMLEEPEEDSGSVLDAAGLKWNSIRDNDAGQPYVQLKVLNVNGLPIKGANRGGGGCVPVCSVSWRGDVVGTTSTGLSIDNGMFAFDSSLAANGANNSLFYVALPPLIDSEGGDLVLSVWDGEVDKKEAFLGRVLITYPGLLRLYNGTFTFPLIDGNLDDNNNKVTGDRKSKKEVKNSFGASSHRFIRGNLTFQICFLFPFWDSITPTIPTIYIRQLRVFSGTNLPTVNNAFPNCRYSIKVNGELRSKSIVVSANVAPVWPNVSTNIVVDVTRHMEVIIELYHIHAKNNKEILLGQETLPFEYFLRPPKGAFEMFLGPAATKKLANFNFALSGSLKIQIIGNNGIGDTFQPFSHSLDTPYAALVARDVRGVGRSKANKTDQAQNGENLDPYQRAWLGTSYDFVRPQQIVKLPLWIVLPVSDLGAQIGPRKLDIVGSRPGAKFSLCIEREMDKQCTSDVLLLEDIRQDVSNCVVALRRKDIFRVVREKALRSLSLQLQAVANKGINATLLLIRDVVSVCFPGSEICTATVSHNADSLFYTCFSSVSGVSGGTNVANDIQYGNSNSNNIETAIQLFQGQGCDWELMGRTQFKSSIVKCVSDMTGKVLATFKPFVNTRFPRFSIPLRSGDAALGFFQVENFDVHMAGLNNNTKTISDGSIGFGFNLSSGGGLMSGMCDEIEVKKWFEDVGDVCGEAIYSAKEVIALEKLKSSYLQWNASVTSLISDVLNISFEVTQGCKLMEILSMDSEYHIKSILQKKPQPLQIPGHEVIVKGVRVQLNNESKEGFSATKLLRGFMNSVSISSATAERQLEQQQKQQQAQQKEESLEDTASQYTFNNNNNVPVQTFLVCGLMYDGVEQCQVLDFDAKTGWFSGKDVRIILKSDRNVFVSLYEVDKDLKVLNDYSGKVNFVSFEEKEVKTAVVSQGGAPNSSHNVKYEAVLSLFWPKRFEFATDKVDKSTIKGFNVNIKNASDLLVTSDIVCELLLDSKVAERSQVKKKTNAPQWDETFFIPFNAKKTQSLSIEIHEMSFLRKGNFLGLVSLPIDQLLNPPDDEIECALGTKITMNENKQTKVGGSLTLQYSIVYFPKKNAKQQEMEFLNDSHLITLPKEVWGMKNPCIELTLHCGTGLGAANRFGGGSDPFVVVYVGDDEEPAFKTKVIDNNLDPQWNETFTISLGVVCRRGVTVLTDFPTIRLEVYDYNRVTAMEFLGACSITPAWYFSRTNGDFQLTTLPGKKNSFVQGTVSTSFELVDNLLGVVRHSYKFTRLRCLQPITYIEIHILKGSNLMKANRIGGKSDPYVVIRWNGKICGETSYKKNNLNPVWNKESFLIDVSSVDALDVPMTLEVWDKDFFSQGEFMGEIRLSREELLHPLPGVQELTLLQKVGKPKGKIQGTLSVKMIGRYEKQLLPIKEIEVNEMKLAINPIESMPLLIAYDPLEEEKRQIQEGSKFPQILQKASNFMEKYLNSPFERSGLMSELHYGQLTAASRRADHTILKTSDVDMLCMPTYFKGQQKLVNSDLNYFVMSRYETGRLPRRDVKFMHKMRESIDAGFKVLSDRAKLQTALSTLVSNSTILSKSEDNPAETLIQILLDVEVSVECNTKIYLLDPNDEGNHLYQIGPSDGEVHLEMPAGELIDLLAKVCRYEIALQLYKGVLKVIDLRWSTFTQVNVPVWAVAQPIVSELERDVATLSDRLKAVYGGGVFVLPLFGNREVFMGLMVLSGIDKIPSAVYKTLIDHKNITSDVDETVPAAATVATASPTSTDTFREHVDMEHGVANALIETASLVGTACFSSRMGNALKKIRSFPITLTTSPQLLIRYVFRQLATTIPAVRELSIWAIDVNKDAVEIALTLNRKKPTMPSKGGLGLTKMIKDSFKKKINASDAEDEELLISVENMKGLGICVGCFGSESPKLLLQASLERATNAPQRNRNSFMTIRNSVQTPATSEDAASKWHVSVPMSLLTESQGNLDESDIVDRRVDIPVLKLVHGEAIRSLNVLNVKSFRVHTGQSLCLIGSQGGAANVLADLFRHDRPVTHQLPSISSPVVSPRASAPTVPTAKAPPAPPAKVIPNYKYFLVVGTHGIGGDSGWGVIGDNVERALSNAAVLLDSSLTRLNTEVTKGEAAGITSGKSRSGTSERK